MTAAVVRWQTVSPDPEASANFYRLLFGWKTSTANAMGYREVLANGLPGGLWPSGAGQPGMTQLFVEVPDLDATLAQAAELGASVIVPKSVLPDGDAMAVLVDPAGIPIGLCTLAGKAK